MWEMGNMDYDYLTSIVSNYTNLPTRINKLNSTQNSFSSLDSLDSISSLNSTGAYSSLQDAVTALGQNSSFSTILSSAVKAAGVSEDMANSLMNIASVDTDNGLESEARSNLIMQNYLYAALIQESLMNQVSEEGDFTSSLFQGLALGDDSSAQTAATAIQNVSLADSINAQSDIEAFV